MIRGLRSAIRVYRRFSERYPLASSDRVSLVHSRTPQQALSELLKLQTRDIHTTSFGLRAIARCLRSSKEPLSDPRYFEIQREVLSAVNELGPRSFSDVIYWLRTALQTDSRNLVEISDRLKETLRLKAQELCGIHHLSNRQLVSMLLDLAQIEVDNTIFLESRLIDRLSDPNELFNFIDYSQTLSFLAIKRHRISRTLFEKVAKRMLRSTADDVAEEIRSLKYLRQIRQCFTWPKLKELQEYLKEKIAVRMNALSDNEAKTLIAGMGDGPRIEMGVESAAFAWLQRKWTSEDKIAEICDNLFHATRFGTFHPERVPSTLISTGLRRLEELLQTQELPLQSLKKLLLVLKSRKLGVSRPMLSAVSAAVASSNDPFVALQLSSVTGEITPDTAAAVQALQSSMERSLADIPLRKLVSILRFVCTHPQLAQSSMLLSFESFLLSQLPKLSEKHISLFLIALTDILKDGLVPKNDLERIFPNVLELIEKQLTNLRVFVCLSLMCMALEKYEDLVRRIVEKHKQLLTENENVETWVRMANHNYDFETYTAFLSLFDSSVSVRGVVNTLRFYTPVASSTSIIQFCSLLDNASGQLIGESFFTFHMHAILEMIEAFPALTQTLRKRLARELELIPHEQRHWEVYLSIYLALKRAGDVRLPSLDYSFLKLRVGTASAPLVLRVLLSESPNLASSTLAWMIVPLYSVLDIHQIRDRFLALSEFGERARDKQWQQLCERFFQKISKSPINTAAEMLEAVASVANPRLHELKKTCFLDILYRIKTCEYPSTDMFVNLLPSLRYIHLVSASDASYVCSSAVKQFPLFSTKEKVRCVSSLGAIGYSDISPYTAAIEEIQNNEAKLLRHAPELLQSVHFANLLPTPLFTSLTNRYCELTHGTKHINTIDFSRASLAICRLSPSWREVLKGHYQSKWSDMNPLRKYLLSLALNTESTPHPQVPGLLSQALPSSVLAVLKRYRQDVIGKTDMLAPLYLPHCDTVLWSPWAEHRLTYTKELNGDLQIYVQAESRRAKKVLEVPQSLTDEQKAKEWLETNSVI